MEGRMIKIDKFEELLEGYRVASVSFYAELKPRDLKTMNILREKLIKMFKDEVNEI